MFNRIEILKYVLLTIYILLKSKYLNPQNNIEIIKLFKFPLTIQLLNGLFCKNNYPK